jgi:hypothetical protein
MAINRVQPRERTRGAHVPGASVFASLSNRNSRRWTTESSCPRVCYATLVPWRVRLSTNDRQRRAVCGQSSGFVGPSAHDAVSRVGVHKGLDPCTHARASHCIQPGESDLCAQRGGCSCPRPRRNFRSVRELSNDLQCSVNWPFQSFAWLWQGLRFFEGGWGRVFLFESGERTPPGNYPFRPRGFQGLAQERHDQMNAFLRGKVHEGFGRLVPRMHG